VKISVLGLGYAGTAAAGCLARDGHEVIGVDRERTRVELVNAGETAGRLRATTEISDALRHADIALVCVGTPSQPNGGIDLRQVRQVCEQIGRTLATHDGAPVIVMRSTVLPGTMRDVVIPALEKFSGKRAGEEFGVCIDYHHPPRTVIGEINRASGELLAALYAKTPGPVVRTDLETAEMVKYADHAWHALKVGFANEIGNLCKALELDAHKVMEILSHELELGGSCLPKDLRALLYKAKTLDLSLPILSSILPSNQLQIERAVEAVIEKGNTKVGILGLSILRDSPMVQLAERLIGKGFELRVYDKNVSSAAMHLSRLMVPSVDDVLAHAQTIVIGNASPEFADVPRRIGDGQTIIDFVRACNSRTILGVYEGICW
jgi:GDP-mannose 6-dehydrogenase